jgi:hypothetical protein
MVDTSNNKTMTQFATIQIQVSPDNKENIQDLLAQYDQHLVLVLSRDTYTRQIISRILGTDITIGPRDTDNRSTLWVGDRLVELTVGYRSAFDELPKSVEVVVNAKDHLTITKLYKQYKVFEKNGDYPNATGVFQQMRAIIPDLHMHEEDGTFVMRNSKGQLLDITT